MGERALAPAGTGDLHGQPAVALYGPSEALLVGPRRSGRGPSLRYRMVAAFGRSTATFGPLRTIDLGAITGTRAPESLVHARARRERGRGQEYAIAAWSRDNGRTSVIRMVERRAGGSLQAVRTRSGLGGPRAGRRHQRQS